MTLPIKHSWGPPNAYGKNRVYLEEVLIGAGAAAPTLPLVTDPVPPCANEIVSVTRTSAGVYVVTLKDCYFAVAGARCDVDDTSGLADRATIGSWTNLGTSTPATFTLNYYDKTGTAKDAPSTTALRIAIAFKKGNTGAAA